MARNQEFALSDLLYFFKNHPDRVIVAAFVMAVIDLILSIPYYVHVLTTEPGASVEAQTNWLLINLLLILLASVLDTVVTIPFAMTYYLMADRLELEGFAGLKESTRLMRGSMGKYLLLQLSFAPWILLSVFTLYLALIWIMPHLQMSQTIFYQKLLFEEGLRKQEEEREKLQQEHREEVQEVQQEESWEE
jgi:uncharacterized membrane protein